MSDPEKALKYSFIHTYSASHLRAHYFHELFSTCTLCLKAGELAFMQVSPSLNQNQNENIIIKTW